MPPPYSPAIGVGGVSTPPVAPSVPPSSFSATPTGLSTPNRAATAMHARMPSTPSTAGGGGGGGGGGAVDPFFHRVLTPLQQSYIRELSSWSSSRLEREPSLLSSQADALQRSVEELALGNYPTFLRTHHVLKDAHSKLRAIDTSLGALHSDVLPALQRACESFASASPALLESAASQRTIQAEQSFLLELLEVPNLMDTCFKNNLINEALQLDLYVKELVDKMQHRADIRATAAAAAAGAGGNAAAAAENDSSALLALGAAPSAPASVPSILLRLSAEMEGIKRNIVRQLLAQLRGPLNVETGFPIVGLLKRTLDIFATRAAPSVAAAAGSGAGAGGAAAGAAEAAAAAQSVLLKYQFLLARNAYFEAALRGIRPPPLPASSQADAVPGAAAAPSAVGGPGSASAAAALAAQSAQHNAALFKYLDEYLYLSRTNLFDIITLYSALFLDHDDAAGPATPAAALPSTPGALASADVAVPLTESQRQQQEDLGLLCRWIHLRIEIMMQTLHTHLPHLSDGSSLLALLQSCMEYGARLSRSKVGLDFRPLLPPLFCASVQGHWRRAMERACGADFDAHMSGGYAWRIPRDSLAKMGISVLQQQGEHATMQPFLAALLPHPPLALTADTFIAATNQLAKCAPLQVANEVGQAAQRALQILGSKIRNAHLAQGSASSSGDAPALPGASLQGKYGASSASVVVAGCSGADLLELGRAFRDAFVPLVHQLLLRVFPHATGILDVKALQQSMGDMFEEERAAAAAAAQEQQEQEQQEQQQAQQQREAAHTVQPASPRAAAADVSSSASAALDADPATATSASIGDTQPAAAAAAVAPPPALPSVDASAAATPVASSAPSLFSPSLNQAAVAALPLSPAAVVAASPTFIAAGSVQPFAPGVSFSAQPVAAPASAATAAPAALPSAAGSAVASSFDDDANDPFAIAAAKIDAQRAGSGAATSSTVGALPATAAPASAAPALSPIDSVAPIAAITAPAEAEAEPPSVDELLAGW